MGPANLAPWLEQVGNGLAEKLTVGRGAEIFKVAVDEPAQHGGPAWRPCFRGQLLEDGPGQFVQAQVLRDQHVLFGGAVV